MQVVDKAANELATLWLNTLIMLSYPFNFVIYCGMSRQFRSTFRAMFCSSRLCVWIGLTPVLEGLNGGYRPTTGLDAEHTNYVSLVTAAPAKKKAATLTAAAAAAANGDGGEEEMDGKSNELMTRDTCL